MKAILLSVAVLSGCAGGGAEEAVVSDGWGSADVRLVKLSDGTRCAVLIGSYKGGITCDWGAK